MINVSNEFKELMKTRSDFKAHADITLADGTVLNLTEEDFTDANNSIVDASGTDGIPLGVAICRTIELQLMNDDGKFSSYDFFKAKVRLYMTFLLSETIEKVELGTFTVISPAAYGINVTITAVDDMYKADVDYSTNLTFPQTAQAVLVDACRTVGISLATISFTNDSFEIKEAPPEGYTFRQIIGYIAMIAGGNARININGNLEIKTYDFSFIYSSSGILSGGTFDFSEADVVSGGEMEPWSDGDVLSGGTLSETADYHELMDFIQSPTVGTDDVVITGVQTVVETEEGTSTILSGNEGYILEIENPLISGNEEEAISLIAGIMNGGRMRSFSGEYITYPLAEFMDPAIVYDRNGNPYATILTDITFVFLGVTNFKNSAVSPEANASKYSAPETKAVIEAKKLFNKEKTAREEAVSKLSQTLAAASGMYSTDVEQEDGSVIRYLHDKKTLDESANVIKVTSQAIGFSQDGGKTYPYGITIDGETITKILYAEGINADYITSGTISDSEGNSLWNLKNGKFIVNNGSISSRGTQSIRVSESEIEDFYTMSTLDDGGVTLVASKYEDLSEHPMYTFSVSPTRMEMGYMTYLDFVQPFFVLDGEFNREMWFKGDFSADSINGFYESDDFPGCYFRVWIVDEEDEYYRETEWVNPPMKDGVVYRTTKRHFGKPVYVQCGSMGTLPNNSTMTVVLGEDGDVFEHVLQLETEAKSTTSGRKYRLNPFVNADLEIIGNAYFSANRTITVKTSYDLSGYNGYWYVEYTKE